MATTRSVAAAFNPHQLQRSIFGASRSIVRTSSSWRALGQQQCSASTQMRPTEWLTSLAEKYDFQLPKGFGRKVESPNGEREGRPASGPAKDGADGSGKEGKPSSGNFKRKKDEQPEIDPWAVGIAAAVLAWTLYSLLGSSRPEGSEISWQEFRNLYLATGMVDRLEVINKEFVRVHLRNTPNYGILEAAAVAEGNSGATFSAAVPYAAGSTAEDASAIAGLLSPEREADLRKAMETARAHKSLYFRIGSVESFERQVEDAQIDLRIRPRDFVLVRHVTETDVASRLMNVLPTLLLVGLTIGTVRMMSGMGGGMMGGAGGGGPGGINRVFSIGKAKPTIITKDTKVKVTFKDVAGCDEAKAEIMEFVQFLKDPSKFTALGAKIPKGALLVGPPGTGKTLLAKATAGESGTPFFSMSGSDFIEMFVGVGPSRVRDLFQQARQAAPSIIFIDEIDAVARKRNKGGFSGGNDERENTLNQLLVEMDGFSTTEGVVVLAGTNRLDILDKAILRPGRFDRQIAVDKPDIAGRKQIFTVHLKPVKIAGDAEAYAQRLAALTPGMVGADIANICNEAAIHAAREAKTKVDLKDFEAAIDRVVGGLEKKHSLMTGEEKRTIAFHEAGHAIAGWFLEHADPLLKVTIIPRGNGALGFAQYLPKEVTLYSKEALQDRMAMALGGRVAEQLTFGRVTTGAQDDLDRVTQMAYAMITVYGMNDRVGPLSFPRREEQVGNEKQYGEATATVIDEEVRKLIDSAYARCTALLTLHASKLAGVAALLLEKETINQNDLAAVAGPRPFAVNPALKEYVSMMFDETDGKSPSSGAASSGGSSGSGPGQKKAAPEEPEPAVVAPV